MVGPAAVEREQFGADAGIVAWLKKHLPRFVYELLELAYAVLDYVRLLRAARRFRPDCIYERYNLFLPSGIWAKRRLRLPLLLEVNAPLYHERKTHDGLSLGWLARWSERYAWRGADYVLPVTEVLAGHVRAVGVPAERVVVVPNGIDPKRFADAPSARDVKAALGLNGRTVLGFVGFMRDWHGLQAVIDLLADSGDRQRHLLLVGDGPARAGLERRAQKRGVAERVTFTGIIGRDQIVRYLVAFDIALQPEVVAYASPLKLFEYLALGRAIVAPARPNIREILVDDENALLFEPERPGSFAGCVERLCRDSQLRQRLGRGAAATIGRCGLTWDHNAARVVGLYRRLGVADRQMQSMPGAP